MWANNAESAFSDCAWSTGSEARLGVAETTRGASEAGLKSAGAADSVAISSWEKERGESAKNQVAFLGFERPCRAHSVRRTRPSLALRASLRR